VLVALNVILLAAGFALARAAGLGPAQARAIAIEGGVQNGTLGITVAGLLAAGAGLGAAAIPSAVYGVTMYFVTLPLVWAFRRAGRARTLA
jgi:BASS family bile acid:Na+ symporter